MLQLTVLLYNTVYRQSPKIHVNAKYNEGLWYQFCYLLAQVCVVPQAINDS